MKQKQLISTLVIVASLFMLSACATKKKKKKCDTCPTWSYVGKVSAENLV